MGSLSSTDRSYRDHIYSMSLIHYIIRLVTGATEEREKIRYLSVERLPVEDQAGMGVAFLQAIKLIR